MASVEGADLVSARVRRQFGARWFSGTVSEVWFCVDDGVTYAHVSYDDGDQEDLSLDDARAALLPAPAPGGCGAGAPAAAAAAAGAASRKRKGHPLMTDFAAPAGRTTRCVRTGSCERATPVLGDTCSVLGAP